jgi:hypothetical protein
MKATSAPTARWMFVTAVHLLAGWSLWSPGASEASVARPCPDGSAVVSGASANDFADVCQGVASALSFFALHGVPAPEPLTIEVTRRLPAEAGETAAGCYLESKRTIYVVPFSTFLTNKTWFGVKIDRAIYRSLASHEVAHAVAACRFLIPNPTIQAKEYLAYVAMFSTMPPALRVKALRGVPAETFNSFDRFTPMLYMFDPMRFGVGAYRHFSSLPGPTSVIRDVLSGKVLTD